MVQIVLEMDVGYWQNFIFSDEAHLELYSKRRQYVRRPVGKRFQSKHNLKTVKIWRFFYIGMESYKRRWSKSVVQVPPILNSRDYQTVLNRFLIHLLKNDSIFMQDGAPCHRSQSTLDFLDLRNICLLSDWPAQSPDLNILENLWSVLKSRVNKRLPKTSDELWAITRKNGMPLAKTK